MGHARALLGLPDEAAQLRSGREVVAQQLSVRETEALVKKALTPARRAKRRQKDVHTRAAEERLRFALGTRVRIVRKGKGGRIEIDFDIGRRTAAALRTAGGAKLGRAAQVERRDGHEASS